MTAQPIVVIGAGPAGAATAAGLARAGEAVVLVGEPRRFAAVEGGSPRVIEALTGLGFHQAVACFAPASPRRASWNGQDSAANSEHLVDRQALDRALLDDVERLGVTVIRGRVTAIAAAAGGRDIQVQAEGATQTLSARFLVEARGRAAPAAGQPRRRGIETVAVTRFWQGPPSPAASAVAATGTGWAWMASLGDGRRYLQWVVDADPSALPSRKALAEFQARQLAGLAEAGAFLRDARPLGEPQARASTPILNEVLVGADWIRVGDAAMAVDPLSGNGLFQSLSSALQAPAVILTLLRSPGRAALARDFHQQRIAHLFDRFARIGRDFYAGETRWADAPFWQARSRWPDAEPLHRPVTPDQVAVARRPVVNHNEIIEADVVVTPDQPLGIWHLQGIPVATALGIVRSLAPGQSAAAALAAGLALPAQPSIALLAWMQQQGWIATPPAPASPAPAPRSN